MIPAASEAWDVKLGRRQSHCAAAARGDQKPRRQRAGACDCVLALDGADHPRYRGFRRDGDHPSHMIGDAMTFLDLAFLSRPQVWPRRGTAMQRAARRQITTPGMAKP